MSVKMLSLSFRGNQYTGRTFTAVYLCDGQLRHETLVSGDKSSIDASVAKLNSALVDTRTRLLRQAVDDTGSSSEEEDLHSP